MPKLILEGAAWAEALWHHGTKYPRPVSSVEPKHRVGVGTEARGGAGEGYRDPQGCITTLGNLLPSPRVFSPSPPPKVCPSSSPRNVPT